jgi:hypothetical protein
LPKLHTVGIKDKQLKKSVYVIRLNGDFCINYPYLVSPVIYIGEGRFGRRINSHKKWIAELEDLVGDFSFEVRIAFPAVRGNGDAYLDCEAALLGRFGEKFWSAPLWNKQFETRRKPNYEYNRMQMDRMISVGSGVRYRWAVEPMRASPFYKHFVKTHLNISL